MKYAYIAIGGALGTLLRYITSSWITGVFPDSRFPWGTFFINMTGSFVIGFIAGLNQSSEFTLTTRLFLFTGLLGGYTTYSAYALETFQLVKGNQFTLAITYVIASTLLGVLFAALGFWIKVRGV